MATDGSEPEPEPEPERRSRRRRFLDEWFSYPTQQDLERDSGYTPGGVNVGMYSPTPDRGPAKDDEASGRQQRTGWRSISGALLRLSLLALIVGFAFSVTGHRWGLLMAWGATIVGLGTFSIARMPR